MARKFTAVLLLSIFLVAIVATSAALGADKPFVRFKDRASFPARFAPVYGFGGSEPGEFAAPKSSSMMTLGPVTSNSVGQVLGSTSYDYQDNGSMGHQVEHRGTGFLHFDWMIQSEFVYPGDRGVGVQSVDLNNCDLSYDPNKRTDDTYSGYVCIDADPGGCAIPIAHGGIDENNMSPRAYWDYCAGGPMGLFAMDDPVDKFGYYQTDGTDGGNQNLWPVGDMQYGTETVLHIITTESGGAAGDPQTTSYYRRVGPYGFGFGSWSAQRVLDTVMNINAVITASTVDDKVAIIWLAPADYYNADVDNWNQVENDVWYVESTMQGADWISGITGQTSISYDLDQGTYNGGNITQYDSLDNWKAYCNVAGLYTTDENLHVIWGCRRWEGDSVFYRRRGGVFHWSTNVTDIRTVVKAEWDTGGACYGHTWGTDVDKISISECDSRLYVLFSQFGNALAPCWDFDSAKKVINSELYLTVSGNNGLNWDKPDNLTNSTAHDCTDNCESDHWATMARFGRLVDGACNGATPGTYTLDIEYINDKTAGGAIQTESGIWTTNPVMWLTTPCRPEVPAPAYSDDAGSGYGECYTDLPLVLQPPSGSVVKSFTMENTGLDDNEFSIAPDYADGSGCMTPNPISGTILAGLNNTFDIDITINVPGGAPDPSVWVADIVITHEAEDSPRILPVCLMVASKFVYPQEAFIATTCKELRVYNQGEMSADADTASLDFNGDCDTLNPNTNAQSYLYSGSPVVSWISGSDTLLFTSAFTRSFVEDDAFRPIDSFSTIDGPFTGIADAIQTKFYTADSSIGFIAEYYSPSDEANCSFIIQKIKFWNRTDTEILGVVVGEVLDWDVPTDYEYDTAAVVASGNYSDYDSTRQLIYQQGIEINDSLEAPCNQDQSERYAGIAPGPNTNWKNSQTLDNPTWVYTSGPYGFEAPLPAGATYELMIGSDNGTIWDSESADTPYIDLSTLVTFGQYDLAPNDTMCAVKILTTSRTGLSYMQDMVDYANALVLANALECPLLTCCTVFGDANNDDGVNVGDAVYMINYVFKSGPPPPCLAEGDANGDCGLNVGDAVYLINYVFKSGPPPVCNFECVWP